MRAFFVPLVALAGIVSAADSNYTVTPSDVDAGTRSTWCSSQTNTCVQLCGGTSQVTTDDCDPSTLEYDCICKNGSAPGLEYYQNSLPTLMCQESFKLCSADNAGDALALQGCSDNINSTCGTLDPSKVTVSSGGNSGSSSTTSAGSSATSGAATSSAAASTSTSTAGAVPTNIQHYGNAAGAVAIGIFAYLL